jgi:hypothetical protein
MMAARHPLRLAARPYAGPMIRRLPIAVGLAAAVIGGCGGSAHSTSTSAGRSTSAGSTTTTAATTTAATTSRPPEVPPSKAQTSTSSLPTAPDTNVRLPASFQIRSGGVLAPPLISAPAGVSIQLRLADLDSKPHSVVLAAPRPDSFKLAPHGRTTTVISGLPKGNYRILVDGAQRGQIVIGSVPGP